MFSFSSVPRAIDQVFAVSAQLGLRVHEAILQDPTALSKTSSIGAHIRMSKRLVPVCQVEAGYAQSESGLCVEQSFFV